MQIRVELFGSFRLFKNGRLINFARKKSKALLAFLILHPRQHTRERLALLFWGDTDIANARRALRVSLTEIRSMLGDTIVLGDQDSLRINSNYAIDVDVIEFLSISKWSADKGLVSLKERLKLYTGDFLEEFYDEWILQLREKYHGIYVDGLLQGAKTSRSIGDYIQAIDFARQVIQIDPFNELAYQHVMVCMSAQGEVEAAIRMYEGFKQNLLSEFGILPSPEIEKLNETLQKQKIAFSSHHYITNIPQVSTSFVGRQEEVEKIKQAFFEKRGLSTLTTLKGPGGVGKSRLALEVARQLLQQYLDGLWWVDLAQISDPLHVAQTVARVAGVKEKTSQDLLDVLSNAFTGKNILLVLDNCEHLISGCADLTEKLLRECNQIHILTTSREPLRVLSEQVMAVDTMPLPAQTKTDYRALINNEAVKLFIERASFIATSFRASEENIQDIVEICRKLDGFPLAIELIAAQAYDKDLKDINLSLTSIRRKGKSKSIKQVNVHSTIQWSYDLLNHTEKALFRRLAIFAGYWNEEQAIQVAGGFKNPVSQLYPLDSNKKYVLPVHADTVIHSTLLSLASKSLINLQKRNENMQFVMLDTIRQFALEKLKEHREYQQASLFHSNYFLSFIDQLWSKMYTPAEKDTIDWIEFNYGNVHLALTYTLKQKNIVWTRGNIASLGRFWRLRGRYREGREWFNKLLTHTSLQKQGIAHATALNNGGLIAWEQGDQRRARAWFNSAIRIQKRLKDKDSLSLSLLNIGNTYFHEDKLDEARPYYEESLKLARITKNERTLSIVLDNLASAIMNIPKEKKRAEKLLKEGLAIRRKNGDKRGVGLSLNNLGDLMAMQGQLSKAQKYFEQSLSLRVGQNDSMGTVIPLLNIANLFVVKKIKLNDIPQILGYVDTVTQNAGAKLSTEAISAIASIKKSTIELIGVPKFTQKYNQGKKLSAIQILKTVTNK
ncbi:MAG: tetratricopeptide repeat protein [Anaerolineales bacterium]